MSSNIELWEAIEPTIRSFEQSLSRMTTEELISYTLDRDHCLPLERELAERLTSSTVEKYRNLEPSQNQQEHQS